MEKNGIDQHGIDQHKDGYLQYVQQESQKIDKVFILDTGEGNDLEDPVTVVC